MPARRCSRSSWIFCPGGASSSACNATAAIIEPERSRVRNNFASWPSRSLPTARVCATSRPSPGSRRFWESSMHMPTLAPPCGICAVRRSCFNLTKPPSIAQGVATSHRVPLGAGCLSYVSRYQYLSVTAPPRLPWSPATPSADRSLHITARCHEPQAAPLRGMREGVEGKNAEPRTGCEERALCRSRTAQKGQVRLS